MKRLLLMIICAAVSYAIYTGVLKDTVQTDTDAVNLTPEYSPSPTPTPVDSAHASVTDEGRTISYAVIGSVPERITLIVNVPVSTDSASAKLSHACKQITSAGFYTREKTPLGLFESDRTIVSQNIRSSLVDGYVYTSGNSVKISYDIDDGPHRFAIQSGPIVRVEGSKRLLSIHTDEFARRVIAAVSANGHVYFIVLFDAQHEFSGPLLSRVPDIIDSISLKENLLLTDAVNLDGGSASVFISPPLTLPELQHAGGFFCIK